MNVWDIIPISLTIAAILYYAVFFRAFARKGEKGGHYPREVPREYR